MTKLKAQLLERKELKEELMLWSGAPTNHEKDSSAELPNHWLNTSVQYEEPKNTDLKRSLSFLALYVCVKAGFEVAHSMDSLAPFLRAFTVYEQKFLEVRI